MSTLSAMPGISLPADSPVLRYRTRWFAAARLLLTLTLMGAPLAFGAVQPWAWGALEVVTLLVLLLWALGTVREPTINLAWSPLYIPGILFLALGLVQYILRLSSEPTSTREALLKLTTDLVLFFLVTQLFANGSRRTLRRFGFAVLVYTFLLSLFSVFQFFASPNRIYWQIPVESCFFGPYVNRNDYAGLMEMLIPLSAGYIASRRGSTILRGTLAFVVLVSAAVLLITGSRGGLISLFAEILILGLLSWKGLSHRSRRPMMVVGSVALAGLAGLFFWIVPTQISSRLEVLTSTKITSEPSITTRVWATGDALRMLVHHPLTGIGLGNFEAVFPQYQTFPSDLRWDHAHDDYAQALAESGVIGGLLIVATLYLFFRLAFGDLSGRWKSRAARIQIGASLGCCGILVHSAVDFNLHIPANAAWFVVCLALATMAVPAAGHDPKADTAAKASPVGSS